MSTMESGWFALLRATYGNTRVHNALADSPLAALGVEWGFGLYVVRAALDTRSPAQELASLFRGLQDAMDSLAVDRGSRSVAVKVKKLHYKTLQMTDDVCTCKYVYEGNVKNTSQRSRFALRCRISYKAFMTGAMSALLSRISLFAKRLSS